MKKNNASRIMLLCFLCYFISYLTRKNFGSIISVLEVEKGIAVSVALTANAIAYGVGQLASGYLGDRIKPVKLIFAGLMTSMLMNFVLPLCPNIPAMTAVWSVNGLAQAFMWPPMVRYLTMNLSSEEYSKACVRVCWGGYIGDMAVYLLSPLCIAYLSWEAVFYFAGGFGLAMAMLWIWAAPRLENKKAVTAENKKTEIKNPEKKSNLKWTKWLYVMIAATMFAIALQGILRDGITTWMPDYMKTTYGWDDAKSILSGVILPIFSVITSMVVSWIYVRFVKNEHTYAGVMYFIATMAALLLYFTSDVNPALSMTLCTVVSVCMHGINYVLICMIPKHFEKYGKISFMSGLLNACTYIGTAIAGYGMAVVSEGFGWKFTILMWSVVAGIGLLTCLLTSKKWGEFRRAE